MNIYFCFWHSHLLIYTTHTHHKQTKHTRNNGVCGPQISSLAFYLASLNSLPHHPISPSIPLLQILYFLHHFLLIESMEAKNRAVFNHKSFKIEKSKKEALESADSMADDEHMSSAIEDDKKKKGSGGSGAAKKGSSGGASSMRCCQAEKCTVDLTDAKTYHQRHRVCEHHAKAAVAIVAGIRQRFCQQCSR